MTETAKPTIETFPAFCRDHGLKCTPQRLGVFAAVCGSREHPSVDGTMEKVRKTVPTVTRESVYRIMNELSSLGVLTRLDTLTSARYDAFTGPHAHFICESCGRIFDYPLPESFRLPSGMPAEMHHFELRVTGVCDACRAQGRKTTTNPKEN